MRQRAVVSLFVALVLSLSPVAARNVVARVNDDASAPVTVARGGEKTTVLDAGGWQKSKKENGLTRVLSAPFRALGRLFGGGKKRQADDAAEAKRREAEAVKKAEAKAAEAARRANAKAAEAAERDKAKAAELVRRDEAARERDARDAAERERAEQQRAAEASRKEEERARRTAETEKKETEGLEGARTFEQRAALTTPPEARPSDSVAATVTSATTAASAADKQGAIIWKPYIENAPLDHLSQGRALLQYGYFNEAIAELSIAATVGPDLIEANNLLGQAYDRIGAHKQAQEYYERALSVAPNNPFVLHNLGYSLYLSDNYDAALKRLKHAAHVAPNDTRIAQATGLVQVRLRKYGDAFKSFARAEGDFYGRLRLAQVLADANLPDEAIKQYQAALRLQPYSPVVLERLADLYQRTGRGKDAEAARRTLAKNRAAGGG